MFIINLTMEVQDLYIKNCQTLLEEIEDIINKRYFMHKDWKKLILLILLLLLIRHTT